jgi:nucleoside-diphosphate-sugar epimerase
MIPQLRSILVIGGGGYVGQELVRFLTLLGHNITVLDTFWYGGYTNPFTKLIFGDIRNKDVVLRACKNHDAVIHLACISNDPSFKMNPKIGEEINYKAFKNILQGVKEAKSVKRFIYASSSSVYGINDIPDVTERTECKPLTDYSKFKLMCEQDLKKEDLGEKIWTIVRPATVCGYSERMRFDLVVNQMTINALVNKKITVHGGEQLRPNLHILDMVRAYNELLKCDEAKIHKETFNVGGKNQSLNEIAQSVKSVLGDDIQIVNEHTLDKRSYHVNSDKIRNAIDFKPAFTIENAVTDIKKAFDKKKFNKPLTNSKYYNVMRMKEVNP